MAFRPPFGYNHAGFSDANGQQQVPRPGNGQFMQHPQAYPGMIPQGYQMQPPGVYYPNQQMMMLQQGYMVPGMMAPSMVPQQQQMPPFGCNHAGCCDGNSQQQVPRPSSEQFMQHPQAYPGMIPQGYQMQPSGAYYPNQQMMMPPQGYMVPGMMASGVVPQQQQILGSDYNHIGAMLTKSASASKAHFPKYAVSTSASIPPSIAELAERYDSAEMFIADLPCYSNEQVEQIELATRGQAENPTWIEQRKGRLTASKIHAVVTRVRKILSTDNEVDTTGLVRYLSGMAAPNPNLPALKYGRAMEDQARKCYIKVMQDQGHRVQVAECGLFVRPDDVYLGATPDGIVDCRCCGTGLLEIKCPLSMANEIPSADTATFLVEDADRIRLKKSHSYYYQVQMQLGVAQKQWCDFFVFSSHGYVRERIAFDKNVWKEIVSCSEYFFKSVYAKHLVGK